MESIQGKHCTFPHALFFNTPHPHLYFHLSPGIHSFSTHLNPTYLSLGMGEAFIHFLNYVQKEGFRSTLGCCLSFLILSAILSNKKACALTPPQQNDEQGLAYKTGFTKE